MDSPTPSDPTAPADVPAPAVTFYPGMFAPADDGAAYVADRIVESAPPADPLVWLRARVAIPTDVRALVRFAWMAQDAYEAAQAAYVAAVDDFYRHDEATADVEAAALRDVIGSGVTKTDAPKVVKTHPGYAAHIARRGELGAARGDAERWLGVARRRNTTALVMLNTCAPLDDGGDLLSALTDASAPDSDGQ